MYILSIIAFVGCETGGSCSILTSSITTYTEKSRPESCGLKPVFLSPTIKYAGCNEFSPKYK